MDDTSTAAVLSGPSGHMDNISTTTVTSSPPPTKRATFAEKIVRHLLDKTTPPFLQYLVPSDVD
jgi:hypothetical protein